MIFYSLCLDCHYLNIVNLGYFFADLLISALVLFIYFLWVFGTLEIIIMSWTYDFNPVPHPLVGCLFRTKEGIKIWEFSRIVEIITAQFPVYIVDLLWAQLLSIIYVVEMICMSSLFLCSGFISHKGFPP